MTRFLREIAAICLHRSADGLIACALWVQRLAFKAEFGSDWRAVHQKHYRQGITRKHWEMQLNEAKADLAEADDWIDQVRACAAETKAFKVRIKASAKDILEAQQ